MIWFLQIAQLSTTISAQPVQLKGIRLNFKKRDIKKVIKIELKLGLGNSE